MTFVQLEDVFKAAFDSRGVHVPLRERRGRALTPMQVVEYISHLEIRCEANERTIKAKSAEVSLAQEEQRKTSLERLSLQIMVKALEAAIVRLALLLSKEDRT